MKKKIFKECRVALVYDRVNTSFGGAERVLLDLHRVFPDAPLFTSVYEPRLASWAKELIVKPSNLQRFPGAARHHRWYVWAMPLAFESLDLSEYEVIISVTSAEAKGVLTKPEQLHVCYLFTPTRYLWSHAEAYQLHGWQGWLQAPIWRYLRWWDQAAAYRPDEYIALSKRADRLCQEFYSRSAKKVIYPALSAASLLSDQTSQRTSQRPPTLPKNLGPMTFILSVNRLVKHKQVDVLITATQQLKLPLVIVGEGPELHYLQRLATNDPNIIFLSKLKDPDLQWLYQNCLGTALIGPEDLGLTPLESIAQGRPALVHQDSGCAELITPNQTGILLPNNSLEAVIAGLQALQHHEWNSTKLKQTLTDFTFSSFQAQFYDTVEQLWQERTL